MTEHSDFHARALFRRMRDDAYALIEDENAVHCDVCSHSCQRGEGACPTKYVEPGICLPYCQDWINGQIMSRIYMLRDDKGPVECPICGGNHLTNDIDIMKLQCWACDMNDASLQAMGEDSVEENGKAFIKTVNNILSKDKLYRIEYTGGMKFYPVTRYTEPMLLPEAEEKVGDYFEGVIVEDEPCLLGGYPKK